LSTPSKPKQILKLNNDNSLIQNTYTLMRKITENIFIVSEKSHSATMLKQLKNFNKQRMIIEPCRKGTTNCILLALRHIKKFYKGKKNDEKILFIHADHIFDDEKRFISSIKNAFDIKEDSIVVGGKKPVCAGTKYGYIKTKKISSSVYKVLQFKEKPDQKTANIL
jgi:mannose-1-phosphate guanylyltransferase